jgi:hypothetical protein
MSREFETPVGTVKRRLHVARQRLKEVLEDGGEPADAPAGPLSYRRRELAAV